MASPSIPVNGRLEQATQQEEPKVEQSSWSFSPYSLLSNAQSMLSSAYSNIYLTGKPLDLEPEQKKLEDNINALKELSEKKTYTSNVAPTPTPTPTPIPLLIPDAIEIFSLNIALFCMDPTLVKEDPITTSKILKQARGSRSLIQAYKKETKATGLKFLFAKMAYSILYKGGLIPNITKMLVENALNVSKAFIQKNLKDDLTPFASEAIFKLNGVIESYLEASSAYERSDKNVDRSSFIIEELRKKHPTAAKDFTDSLINAFLPNLPFFSASEESPLEPVIQFLNSSTSSLFRGILKITLPQILDNLIKTNTNDVTDVRYHSFGIAIIDTLSPQIDTISKIATSCIDFYKSAEPRTTQPLRKDSTPSLEDQGLSSNINTLFTNVFKIFEINHSVNSNPDPVYSLVKNIGTIASYTFKSNDTLSSSKQNLTFDQKFLADFLANNAKSFIPQLSKIDYEDFINTLVFNSARSLLMAPEPEKDSSPKPQTLSPSALKASYEKKETDFRKSLRTLIRDINENVAKHAPQILAYHLPSLVPVSADKELIIKEANERLKTLKELENSITNIVPLTYRALNTSNALGQSQKTFETNEAINPLDIAKNIKSALMKAHDLNKRIVNQDVIQLDQFSEDQIADALQLQNDFLTEWRSLFKEEISKLESLIEDCTSLHLEKKLEGVNPTLSLEQTLLALQEIKRAGLLSEKQEIVLKDLQPLIYQKVIKNLSELSNDFYQFRKKRLNGETPSFDKEPLKQAITKFKSLLPTKYKDFANEMNLLKNEEDPIKLKDSLCRIKNLLNDELKNYKTNKPTTDIEKTLSSLCPPRDPNETLAGSITEVQNSIRIRALKIQKQLQTSVDTWKDSTGTRFIKVTKNTLSNIPVDYAYILASCFPSASLLGAGIATTAAAGAGLALNYLASTKADKPNSRAYQVLRNNGVITATGALAGAAGAYYYSPSMLAYGITATAAAAYNYYGFSNTQKSIADKVISPIAEQAIDDAIDHLFNKTFWETIARGALSAMT